MPTKAKQHPAIKAVTFTPAAKAPLDTRPSKGATNGPTTHVNPGATPAEQVRLATIANNQAKRRAEEQEAAASNAVAKIPAKQRGMSATPAPKKVGSGAGVGVAAGAMDGQPHTRIAVEQARKRFNAENQSLVVNGVTYPNATRASDARMAIAANKGKPAAQPKPKATPKAKAEKPAKPQAADQKIVRLAKANPYKEGTKAHATFTLMGKFTTTQALRAEVERTGGSGASGQYDAGYLRYAARDGHIKLV